MSDSLLLEDERRIEEREQIAERWASVNWAPEPMTKAGLKNVLMAALRELDSKRFIADEITPLDEFVEHYTTLIPQGVQPRPYKVVAIKDAERACADYSALLLSRLKAEREKNEKLMLGLDSALRDLDFDSPRQAKRTLNELLRAAAKESHVCRNPTQDEIARGLELEPEAKAALARNKERRAKESKCESLK